MRSFRKQHGRVIYKSISAVGSIVQELSDEDDERLERIRWCPTEFQAFVEGTNVRVHTVGGEAFATALRSEATDYRSAGQAGEPAELREVMLAPELEDRCVALSQSLGLEFAGNDLEITSEMRCTALRSTQPSVQLLKGEYWPGDLRSGGSAADKRGGRGCCGGGLASPQNNGNQPKAKKRL